MRGQKIGEAVELAGRKVNAVNTDCHELGLCVFSCGHAYDRRYDDCDNSEMRRFVHFILLYVMRDWSLLAKLRVGHIDSAQLALY